MPGDALRAIPVPIDAARPRILVLNHVAYLALEVPACLSWVPSGRGPADQGHLPLGWSVGCKDHPSAISAWGSTPFPGHTLRSP